MPGCPAISMPPKRPDMRPRRNFWRHAALCLALIFTLFMGMVTFSAPAEAGYTIAINDHFTCDAPSTIVQTLPTPTTDPRVTVFKFVLSVYQTSLFIVMAEGYCAMRAVVEGPLYTALLLAVVVFGIGVLTGLTRLTIREGMMLLFKLSLVVMFALNAQIAMSVVFKLFYNIGDSMMSWADPSATTFLSGTSANIPTGGADPDSSFNKFATYFTDTKNGKLVNACAGPLLLFLTVFAALFPVIGAPLVVMMLTFVMLFVRTILGFLVAMGALCMLMTTAPLFIGFALFRITYGFFDRWLKSMVSYSLQMVLVFFIVWSALKMFDFFDMFTHMEKALAPPPDASYSFVVSDITTSAICTPCKGFKFANPSTSTGPAAIGFDQYTCDGPLDSTGHAKEGVALTANLTETVPTFGAYILTNVIYLLVLLWAIKEMVVAAPLIAYQLAGDTNSMSLGGRVGRTGTPAGAQEQNSFDFGDTANPLDRRMDKMTEYMRFAIDTGYQRDLKDEVRKQNPEFLTGNIFSRVAKGAQLGWALSDSSLSPEQIYEQLPQHMNLENTKVKDNKKLIQLQAQVNTKRAEILAKRQQMGQKEVSQEMYDDALEKYEQMVDELEEQIRREQENDEALESSFETMRLR